MQMEVIYPPEVANIYQTPLFHNTKVSNPYETKTISQTQPTQLSVELQTHSFIYDIVN
jgi:hypothetical protein